MFLNQNRLKIVLTLYLILLNMLFIILPQTSMAEAQNRFPSTQTYFLQMEGLWNVEGKDIIQNKAVQGTLNSVIQTFKRETIEINCLKNSNSRTQPHVSQSLYLICEGSSALEFEAFRVVQDPSSGVYLPDWSRPQKIMFDTFPDGGSFSITSKETIGKFKFSIFTTFSTQGVVISNEWIFFDQKPLSHSELLYQKVL